MPQPGKCWRHVVIGTWNSWLPGDPRGFRAKDHKVHSSGDYKNPPPEGEHAGLFEYSKQISGEAVVIPKESRELSDDMSAIRRIVGQCKSASSHAVREEIPGRVWAREGSFKPVKDVQHHGNVYRYIPNQEDAWVWSFKEEENKPAGERSEPAG